MTRPVRWVVVEGTGASMTFAFTVSADPLATAASATEIRAAVTANLLDGAIEDETVRWHGPVLLPAGTVIDEPGPHSSFHLSGPLSATSKR